MRNLQDQLDRFAGVAAEPRRVARYPVNEAMIRNWVEAHDDDNPIYVDDAAARAAGRPGVVCPPAMISTWVMAGYRRYREIHRLRAEGHTEDFPYSRLLSLLDEAGFTSVVATDLTQEYVRDIHVGEHITAHITIEAISPMKRTALGNGHFITLLKKYVNQDGELLVEERFRLLRFAPESRKDP
ncbi:FAS1-like dehydratase domain-containing protein [Tamaricihabitans halophyticus]|uniref:FAS1-like dehydratase domain-containing protein n=1 Tax=Tamaricihabitans halophyticus TaxID=1262583 RepID=UPI0010527F54|nr:MaoC family dehydratase N-terminal domain-containing protein [Tamaricihabitans halophyticus]